MSKLELIENVYLKSEALKNIAVYLAGNGGMAGAMTTVPLIEHAYLKSEALKNIAVYLAGNGDMARAITTALLIEHAYLKSEALKNIAVHCAENGDMALAKEVFNLAKEAALLMPDKDLMPRMLQDIMIKQARSGDITGAKTGIAAMKKMGYFRKAVMGILKLVRIMNSKK